MQVRSVITRRVEWVAPDTTVHRATTRMRDLDVGALPVFEADRLIGMITDRDVAVRAVAEGRDCAKTTVRDVMSPGIVYCYDDQDVSEAVRIMKQERVRRLVVLNRAKRLVGIVSLGDLALSASERLAGEALRVIARPLSEVHQ